MDQVNEHKELVQRLLELRAEFKALCLFDKMAKKGEKISTEMLRLEVELEELELYLSKNN